MDSALSTLARWMAAGGEWRVVGRTTDALTVALLTCDRGEEMGRLSSGDADFVVYVSAHDVP